MAAVTGKLLHIDLTTKQSRPEELSETTMRKYLGGGTPTTTKLAELGLEVS